MWKFVYIEQDAAKWDRKVDTLMKESDAWVDQQITRVMESKKRFNEEKKAVAENAAE